MNETLQLIHQRRSVRAPTAGNLMLYSILEVKDPAIKEKLAVSCDNQPFIARAPLILIFLADYQRWMDAFIASDVPATCERKGETMRRPGEGDLLLACCDALIAAQTAVIAAESLGLGSCYVGDIMEQCAYHRALLDLPRYTFPVTLVCFGYPTAAAKDRELSSRFPRRCIHFKDSYRRLDDEALHDMLESRRRGRTMGDDTNVGQHTYARKFSADFTVEMTRSVREAIRVWTAESQVEP